MLFPFDKPASGNKVLGRKEEIQAVMDTLVGKQKGVALYAAPKSGKNTVVREALHRLKASGWQFRLCEIDLFNVRTLPEFIDCFKRRMLTAQRPFRHWSKRSLPARWRSTSSTKRTFRCANWALSRSHLRIICCRFTTRGSLTPNKRSKHKQRQKKADGFRPAADHISLQGEGGEFVIQVNFAYAGLFGPPGGLLQDIAPLIEIA